MDEAGWRGQPGRRGQAGRQCTLAIIHIAGVTWLCLRPSGPQRQSRLSVGRLSTAPGSPTSGLPGVGQFEQGGAGGCWLGGGGGGLDVRPGIFPSSHSGAQTPEIFPIQRNSQPAGAAAGRRALGLLDAHNVHTRAQKAGSSSMPACWHGSPSRLPACLTRPRLLPLRGLGHTPLASAAGRGAEGLSGPRKPFWSYPHPRQQSLPRVGDVGGRGKVPSK